LTKKETKNNLKTSKLIGLLAKLPPKTAKQFKAWMKNQGSPNRDAFLVLTYLLLHYPEFDSTNLAHPLAFKKIFKKTAYDYRRLMKAVSQIHLDLKDYLVQIELKNDDFLSDFLLAKVYNKYDLVKERTLLINKQLKPQKELQYLNDFWYELHWQDFSFFSENKLNNKNQNQQNGILKAEKALDWYYLGKKLKYACEIATQEKLYNLDHKVQFADLIRTFCKTNYVALPIYHQVFFSLWQFIQTPNLNSYNEIKEIFEKNYQHFEQQDQFFIIAQFINFISNQLRKKEENALEELYELYKFGIEKAIFVLDESFVSLSFINLISICSALEKFAWIEKILNNQLGELAKAYDISTYSIAMARLSFAKKDFQACIAHLVEVDYSLFIHSRNARMYQIACGYEMRELPQIIETNCKSFENYLRRNQEIYLPNIQSGLNFIFMVRKLNKFNPDKNRLTKIFSQLTPIAFHIWLKEKIDELP